MSTATAYRSFLLFSAVASLGAAAVPASAGWSFSPSVAASAGYDDNVFLQERGPVVAPGAVAPANAGSSFAVLSGNVAASHVFSPAFRFDGSLGVDVVRYEAYESENHDDYRLQLGASGTVDDWSYQFKSSLLVVEGDGDGLVFGRQGGAPSFGAPGVRARRDQLAFKMNGQATRKLDHGFVRLVGDGCANDFRTRQSAATGYANYVDRAEWTAGADAGRDVSKGLAVVVGARGGVQRQADKLGVPLNYDNRLVRLLAGVEGRPHDTLTLRVLAGPDFRRYDRDVAAGFDRTRTARYAEASATWTPDANDTVALTYKDYLWLSAGGRGVYQSSCGNLKWTRRIDADWSVSLAGDVQVGDNRDIPQVAQLDDWICTAIVGVKRRLGASTTLELEYLHEWGESGIPATSGRDYERNQITLGVRRTF